MARICEILQKYIWFFKALSKAKERVRTPVNEVPAIEEKGVCFGKGHALLTKGNKISHSRQVFKIKHIHSIRIKGDERSSEGKNTEKFSKRESVSKTMS